MSAAVAILQQLEGMGVTVSINGDSLRFEPGSVLSDELKEQITQHKPEIRRHIIIREAYLKADRVNDAMGLESETVREYNRLSWAVQDLQDASEPESVWRPLLEQEHALGRKIEGRRHEIVD